MRASFETSERTNSGAWDLVGKRLGRYEILHLLASGGMGAVFVGRAVGAGGFERLVAIKVLHRNLASEEEFVSMFLDEARLAAQIHHPNVVATLDVASGSGDHYLVMEYVAGTHLGELSKGARSSGEPIPVPISVRIALDVLAGLSASHDLKATDGSFLNLVHRDVSPVNIQVGADGITKLTDFGVAKAEARLSSTRKGEFKGKLAYAAPEHLSGQDDTNLRSDLFSMGVVLWETLANRRLFGASNSAAIVQQLLIEPIPLLSSVRPELSMFDAVLERALMRDPAKRFASASEMSIALEEAASEHEYDGAAGHAAVGAFVEKAAAKKLQTERAAVQKARASFEQLKSAPPSADELLPPTLAAPTPTFIRRRVHSSKRWMLAAAGAALLGIGILVAMLSGPSPETPTAARDARTGAGEADAGAEQAAEGTTPAERAAPGAETAAHPAAQNDQARSASAASGTAQNEAGSEAAANGNTSPSEQARLGQSRGRPADGRRTPVRPRVSTTRPPPTPAPPPAPSNPYE